MKNKYNYIFLHIAGCIMFMIIPIMLSPRPPHMPFFSRPTFRDFLASCIMLLFFYLNYYLFIPKIYFKKIFIWYTLIITIVFFSICIIPSLLTGYIPWDPPHHPGIETFAHGNPKWGHPAPEGSFFLTQVKHNIFLYAAVVLFSILLRMRTQLLHIEILKHDAEMSTLKSQINPHFLFNTLNNIYALAMKEKSPSTATSILKLSDMMRYVVTETRNELVPLDREISYINDYIELQKMRLNKNLHLSYIINGVAKDQKIAPLILIPFIENAFKYGVNPDLESYINIKIDISDTELALAVENQKVSINQDLFEKSGVGVKNTKARLAILYSKKHYLSLIEDLNTFKVQLNIELM